MLFLGSQEAIQDKIDLEGVLASILGRFLKASERQKLGFRIGGVQFLRISGVVRQHAILDSFWDRFGLHFGRVWAPFWDGFGRMLASTAVQSAC